MKTSPYVHWNEDDSKVSIDVELEEPMNIKAEMFDSNGRSVMNIFDRHCRQGHFNTAKRIEDLSKGIYIMRISSKTGEDTIRFKVH